VKEKAAASLALTAAKEKAGRRPYFFTRLLADASHFMPAASQDFWTLWVAANTTGAEAVKENLSDATDNL
jgi:hypothetical protein